MGKKKVLLVVFVAMVLLLSAVSVSAKAIRTDFTGLSYGLGTLEPGQSWTSNGVEHVRDQLRLYYNVSTDERFDGYMGVYVNYNWHIIPPPANRTGPAWGTWQIGIGDDRWVGTWTGTRDENGHAYVQFVGQGEGGYEGLELRMTGVRQSLSGPTNVSGYILEPGEED